MKNKFFIVFVLMSSLGLMVSQFSLAHPHDGPKDTDTHDPEGHNKDGRDDTHDSDGKDLGGADDGPD